MPKTILVVEDNVLDMKLFCDLLGAHGYATLQARDGRSVAGLVRDWRPDLILMDIQLPDMNGIEALRLIRTDHALDGVAVIAVSASVMPEDQQKIVASGFDAFVTKPINLKAFVDTVRRHLGGRVPP